MKKSLFAIAAVTAFAGAAQAQSSVTVYGIIDVGYLGNSARVPATGSPAKSTNNQFGASAETSSRLGFRGNEDLGGGLSAFFTLEVGVNPNQTNYTFNNRQTFAGLAKKGVGAVSAGTQYTALWLNSLNPTDPGAGNNVAGSIIRPVGVAGSDDGQGAQSTAVTILTTNSLYAVTERMAGLRLGANYVMNGNDGTQRNTNTAATMAAASNGGSNNFTGYSLSADYTWKKLLVTAAYSSFKQEQNSGLYATAALINPTTPIMQNQTGNTNDAQMYAGAVYDFGILKAYAGYVNRKVSNGLNTNQYAKRSGQQIGVRSFITPTIESWASAGTGSVRAFGASEPTANLVAYQLGTNYYLSKRTNLYGIVGHSQTSSVQGGTAVATNQGAAITGYAIGVRHTF